MLPTLHFQLQVQNRLINEMYILELIEKLEEDYKIGIHLGNNLYKIRVKNSDFEADYG